MKQLIYLVTILAQLSSTALLSQDNNLIYAENGRLYHPGGKEVAMWGVNLQPCLSWEYNALMKGIGIKEDAGVFKKMTDESLDELELLGCKVIRCHLTPGDFTDDKGNLVETIYLDALDYMIAETAKHNMYCYIAFINHMGQNNVVPGSFMNTELGKFDYRARWILDQQKVEYSKNFITQLLNRKNPYNHTVYKNDSSMAVWEIMNEPRYYSYEAVKETPYYANFTDWATTNKLENNESNYLKYRKQLVLGYINDMYQTIRATGDRHPIAWNCNWNRMIMGHEDVFEAIAESDVEVTAFCNYPGQNVVKHPYQSNPEDLTRYDFTEWYQNFYDNKNYYGWVLSEPFKNKAKIVYEFETFYNQSAYLYPLMADFLRAMGVQMTAMWQYSMPGYATYRSGSHVLNLKCTPAKAASFAVAGKIFENTPIMQPYHTESINEWETETYTYSYKNDMSLYCDDDVYYYSNNVKDSESIKPGALVRNILGYGSSPIVKYDGTGLYKIMISDNQMDIIIQPDAIHLKKLWQRYSQSEGPVTRLDDKVKHIIQIDLDGWEKGKYTLFEFKDGKRTKVGSMENLKLEITPGSYQIVKNTD